MAQSRNEIRYAEQQIESIGRRLDRLDEERQKWADQRESITKRKQELSTKLEETVKEIEHARLAYVQLTQTLKSKQGLLDEAQAMVRKWEQKLDALISRRDTMKEMANDYDGFQQGVKEVLKAKTRKDLRGIRGAVAELVKVPANVEIAIETALGGALQNIIVETEADGREAIAFLKRRQMGRATFLPMNVIRGRSISDHESQTLKSSKGFVGIAVDLVSFDSTYTNIFSSLLGNVVVAESLEDANHIAAKAQYRYRVVTLEGDVVNPGGSMTGGSLQKKSTNLLGRERQIEELDAEIETSEGQLSGLRSQSSSLKREITDEMLKVEQLRQLGEQQRITEQQIRAELNPLESESRTVEEQLTLDSQDRNALTGERTDFGRKKVESEATLAELQEEEASLQQAIRDAESSRKASESEKEELQSQLTDLKVKVASTSQEKQSLQDQQRRLQQDLSDAEREIEVNRGLLTQLERIWQHLNKKLYCKSSC